jgi:hypothetical protein
VLADHRATIAWRKPILREQFLGPPPRGTAVKPIQAICSADNGAGRRPSKPSTHSPCFNHLHGAALQPSVIALRVIRPLLLPATLISILACSHRSPVAESSSTDAPIDPVDLAVCGERIGCYVEQKTALGMGADQTQRLAAVARLSPPPRAPIAAVGPVAEDPWESADGLPMVGSDGCNLTEVWLVTLEGGTAKRTQLLTRGCSAGPIPLVPHPPEELSVFGYNGAILTFKLDPPHLRRVTRGRTWWDWDAFRGEKCRNDKQGCAPVLPHVGIADDGSFSRDGWRVTGLGECSLRFGDPRLGASLAMMLAEAALYVEVTDDHFVTHGKLVDTVKLVSTSIEGQASDVIWVDRLTMDGTWISHDGGRTRVNMSMPDAGTRRFQLSPAPALRDRHWLLEYEDTDDGRTIQQRVGPHEGGQPVLVVAPRPACAAHDGALRVVPTRSEPDAPLAP